MKKDEQTLQIKSQFDTFETFALAVKGWGLDFQQLDCGPFNARLHQFGSQNLLITNAQFNRNILQRGTYPDEMYTFGLTVSQTRPTIKYHELKRNSLSLFPKGENLDAVSHSDFHCYTFMIANQVVEKRLTENLPYFVEIMLRQGGLVDSASGEVQELRQFLISLNDEALKDDEFIKSEKFNSEVPDMLLDHVISVLSAAKERTYSVAQLQRTKLLQDINSWLAESVCKAHSVEEISKRFQVNERKLRRIFSETYRVSPQQYLLALRLNGARRDLYQASASTTKIGDIANRWDFWHMGKFAKYYHRQFGELPSETLMYKGSAGQ